MARLANALLLAAGAAFVATACDRFTPPQDTVLEEISADALLGPEFKKNAKDAAHALARIGTMLSSQNVGSSPTQALYSDAHEARREGLLRLIDDAYTPIEVIDLLEEETRTLLGVFEDTEHVGHLTPALQRSIYLPASEAFLAVEKMRANVEEEGLDSPHRKTLEKAGISLRAMGAANVQLPATDIDGVDTAAKSVPGIQTEQAISPVGQ